MVGNESNPLSVWGYQLDILDQGNVQIINGSSPAQEIYLVTYSQLTTATALSELAVLVGRSLPILLTYLLVALLPGLVALKLIPQSRQYWLEPLFQNRWLFPGQTYCPGRPIAPESRWPVKP